MTFRSLALSNVRGNWRSYSAFFLSSVFSVLIFYIYAAFLNHPDVLSGQIIGASKVKIGMQYCLYIIMIFSFLFILYSNSAFLKTRKQEFGLFSLFGMTRSQLRKLVIYENMVIAVLAIAAGIGLGILFSKLFFMALAALLGMDETISFAVPMDAVWLTAGGFFALFLIISIWSVLRIGKQQIIELLKAARQPKGKLTYKKWQVVLGALCLVSGYGMAFVMNSYTFIILSLPILVTVVAGTYFLFTQLSIVFLRFVQKRHGVYYNRTNMLIVAQLGYKIRDNARILFVVSILSAVIMTALGTVYLMQIQGKQDMLETSPFSIAYVERGLHAHEVIDPDQLKRTIAEDGFTVARESKIVGVGLDQYVIEFTGDDSSRLGWGDDPDYRYTSDAMIISVTDYNKLAGEAGREPLVAESGKLTVLYSSFDDSTFGSGTAKGRINGEPVELPVSGSINVSMLNNWLDSNAITLVMDDLGFVNLLASVPEEQQRVFYGYELNNWEESAGLVKKLDGMISEERGGDKDFGRAERFARMKETISLTLFIGMFISLLFFIAAGSMIYFKLFTEIQEDQAQFRGLSRIGMTRKEIRRVVVSQIAIVFFIPCVVGISHALFAMRSLDNMMNTSNWIYSFVVIGIYIVMQTLYFLLASNSYMKSMLRGSAA
ncbi:ABC transporter permease [Paenibacillus soyae]|uniref:ABC transporter permease n=1 Tax=Paenibacillus soyae TaxID=2969249 RepID=A0A9X2MTJ1_9BACL|nr:ABC transporter permease [Paenibacillus soyae]MCR2806205.1 ABC transporter permease [Paenibacillus soyae]